MLKLKWCFAVGFFTVLHFHLRWWIFLWSLKTSRSSLDTNRSGQLQMTGWDGRISVIVIFRMQHRQIVLPFISLIIGKATSESIKAIKAFILHEVCKAMSVALTDRFAEFAGLTVFGVICSQTLMLQHLSWTSHTIFISILFAFLFSSFFFFSYRKERSDQS